ncbi:MAG: hypothetical protein LBT20_02430 [Clostridiales bacterium]|jgi:ABC-type nitrate/sulfonate/bicarbonate transport system substrate-binding protein|nr:hypothetical protein [Clostridiales bacterium]
MKKQLAKLLTVVLVCALLTVGMSSCNWIKGLFDKSDKPSTDPEQISVIMPDGAPLLSLAKLRTDNQTVAENYEITYNTVSPTLLSAELIAGRADIAVAPINVCAAMYNNGSGYLFAGVNIYGILHIVSNQAGDISLSSLAGETVVAFTEAGTPGITLRAVLKGAGLQYEKDDSFRGTVGDNKVHIVYLSDAAAVRNALAANGQIDGKPVKYAMLAEPVVTAVAASTAYKAVINIQTEWAKYYGGEIFPQAGIIFKASLLEKDKAFVDAFIAAAKASTEWAALNPFEAGELTHNELESPSIPNGTVVQKAVEAGRLPLVFTSAGEAKASVTAYLTAILEDGPSSAALIGGKVPDDGFFYVG